MKKIIKNKLYDTETARFQAEYENDYSVNDFNYYSEGLYLKKTGEYFLHCAGGGLSPYAKNYGGSWGWGEEIKPLSFEEAQAWAQEKLDGEAYESVFGEVEEGQSSIGLTIDNELKSKLDRHVQRTGKTLKETVIEALEEFLDKE